MPRCLNCGNGQVFGSSRVYPGIMPGVRQGAGMVASFDDGGQIINLENRGNAWEEVQGALDRPENFFDVCYHCGSSNLRWP